MAKNKKPKIHLIILFVLVLVFFGIIVLATTTRNIITNYSFEDEVVYSGKSNLNNKIGEVVVSNDGVLSSRVRLKSIRACTFNETIGARDIDIEYVGAQTSYFNNLREFKVDVSPKDEVTLKIKFNYFPVPITVTSKELDEIDNEVSQIYELYLFEVDRSENKYDFCENVEKEDAFKVVKVHVQEE
jgi:hypothetical protein